MFYATRYDREHNICSRAINAESAEHCFFFF